MTSLQYQREPFPEVRELEEQTATLWLGNGTIHIVETGSENTYYKDQFGNRFYCKNYPVQYFN